jgi:hypothetical protein
MPHATCHTHPIHIIWLSVTYIVSYSERKLERIQVADEDSFSECLQEILRSIDQKELNSVFQAWMGRVQEVSQGNRDYVRW